MQFTRFPGRHTTGGTTHGVYLPHGEVLGFPSVVVFLLRRWLNRQEENLPFCSCHVPSENCLESLLYFLRGEAVPHLTHYLPKKDRVKATERTAQY
jgi:hypothetical protein